MRNVTAWYSVRGSNPSGQLERLVTSPKVKRCETGAPGLIRTDDLLLTRQALPPTELQGLRSISWCPRGESNSQNPASEAGTYAGSVTGAKDSNSAVPDRGEWCMPTRFARCARALIQHIAPSRSRGRSWAPGARTHPNWSGYAESNCVVLLGRQVPNPWAISACGALLHPASTGAGSAASCERASPYRGDGAITVVGCGAIAAWKKKKARFLSESGPESGSAWTGVPTRSPPCPEGGLWVDKRTACSTGNSDSSSQAIAHDHTADRFCL